MIKNLSDGAIPTKRFAINDSGSAPRSRWVSTDWDIAIRMRALNENGVTHHFFHQTSGTTRLDEQALGQDVHHKRNYRLVTVGEQKMAKYQVVVSQDEDGVFVVECPALPGCVTEGDTKDEALENIREAIQVYLETVNNLGIQNPVHVYEVEV